MNEVTVLLNGYKRGQNLTSQIEAINNQTVKPKEIMLWYNYPGDKSLFNYDVVYRTAAAINNRNYGVWARFAFALNARTKYICVFDDDTIPGNKWLENCLNTIQTHRGLLGTIGLICHRDNYFNHMRIGWANPNEKVERVDLVGHSWFFEREFLTAMWSELPPIESSFLCGEDMHFSYTLQKYKGLNTYVPPHPKDDTSMWGSLQGWQLGVDQHAISHMHLNQHNQTFRIEVDTYFKRLLSNGWKLVTD